ncbi:hypothetical protein CHLNCDRAFT_31757 [Chlorella variabilis]|uniref:UBA domain-containing protein n=1 Tax=Chlorella variabilis TaxID=554065 RepID=E1ZIQ9_CHLVA|nr:hypothetical protein CHLNCDRAFT_31757 [Chlorella variabilis]EFN54376.1 hypothetical protein CHLNCDRAFT_31757 [Chlorella variabilis]|eukprot:XP_005846478.1 hypothetical protein CHLNCDRAFT_31757 [Chlorella variabilis]
MAALSLKCDICGVALRSVAEAQAHGDATGHAAFSESTEAVKRLVCRECGKACRSSNEWDLHSKRTGHAEFDDKVGGQGILSAGEAPCPLINQNGQPAGGGSQAEELVPAEVNADLLKQMEEMGFPAARATRALYHSGGENLEAAVGWLEEHQGDADLDEPLLVPKSQPKKKLSPEEAKAQAAELVRKVRERREREERETERLREQERIRAGKELALAARQEEELRLKRMVEARQREKEEEERARAKIKAKLEEDRRERRRRLGLPEELTEEEREEERRKVQAKVEEEKRRRLPIKPVEVGEKMRTLLVDMKKAHPGQDDALKTCWQTLLKMCGNIYANPGEDKFRRVRLTNPAIQQRVAAFTGAVDFLHLAGFQRDAGGENLEMPADKVDRAVLEVAGEQLNSALNNPFFGIL